ncbi:hypothetical protein N183_36480 [Sinorhizobium sp. Sb3]|nr:hypothetical protein N183_36480 [Sinorhizobium sp. Sb3]
METVTEAVGEFRIACVFKSRQEERIKPRLRARIVGSFRFRQPRPASRTFCRQLGQGRVNGFSGHF